MYSTICRKKQKKYTRRRRRCVIALSIQFHHRFEKKKKKETDIQNLIKQEKAPVGFTSSQGATSLHMPETLTQYSYLQDIKYYFTFPGA